MAVTTPAGPGTPAPDAPPDRARPTEGALVAIVTVICGLLVAHRLGDHGFWFDEGSTIGTVDRPVGDALWRIYHWELNQSPYHLLALGWLRLVEGEAAMRALSGVLAVACVPMAWGLGRRLLGGHAGVVAATLVAVHPFVIQWGQQLRGYSLLLLLSLGATWLLVRLVERPTTSGALAYGVVAAVAVYAQLFSALLLAAHAAAVLVAVRPVPKRALAVAGATCGLLLLPMAEFFLTRDGDPLSWVDRPNRHQLLGTAEALAGGGPLQLWTYGAACVAGLVVLARRWRSDASTADRLAVVLPVAVLVVPPVATVALSLTVKPLVEARFLMVAVPGIVLVAASAVDEALRSRRDLGLVALASLVLVSGFGLRDWYDREPFEEWREAVVAVAAAAEPGDVVIPEPIRGSHVVRYYAEDLGMPASVGYPEDLAAARPGSVFELVRQEPDGSRSGWLRPDVAALLADRYQVVDEQSFAGVLVRRHVAR